MTVESTVTNPIVSPYAEIRQKALLKQTKYILIVDDQSTGRFILTQVIQQISPQIQVIAMDSPDKAIDWLNHHPVDLIITDYRMPEMNGIQFIEVVRNMESCIHVPVVMITVVSERKVRHQALEAGATAFLTRPIDPIECKTTCKNLLIMHEQHHLIQDKANWLARQVEIATAKINQREKETILRLARAGEYRDEDTGAHILRLSKYSRLIAEQLGNFSQKECEEIEYAAPMHDIGKIGIPDKVLLKPGKLDTEEWEIMKTHTAIGYSILSDSQSKYMEAGAIIALNHHERIDGKGYPNGLKGEQIPLIARIVAVADVFDALVSERPYKQAWTFEQALDYLKTQAGSHLDSQCVEAFLSKLNAIKLIHSTYSD